MVRVRVRVRVWARVRARVRARARVRVSLCTRPDSPYAPRPDSHAHNRD